MEPDRNRRFLLITYPRTASNLLVRILSLEDQPKISPRSHGGYFFLPPVLLCNDLKTRAVNIDHWTEDQKTQMMQSYQASANELEKYAERAAATNKLAFVKEHSDFMIDPTAQSRFLFSRDSVKEPAWTVHVQGNYGSEITHSPLNETVLPDEFLKTWLPTFLIRHPALVFPSHYRTFVQTEGMEAAKTAEAELTIIMTMHWSRTLYDWYSQYASRSSSMLGINWPLILDADDVITNPDLVVRYCNILGLDETKLKFSWKPASEDEVAKLPDASMKIMLSTLLASSGIVGGKTAEGLDIDTEAKKWREEFGEDEGQKIEGWVKAAMPDYEFMKQRRLGGEHAG